jgi:hypothetical protein
MRWLRKMVRRPPHGRSLILMMACCGGLDRDGVHANGGRSGLPAGGHGAGVMCVQVCLAEAAACIVRPLQAGRTNWRAFGAAAKNPAVMARAGLPNEQVTAQADVLR